MEGLGTLLLGAFGLRGFAALGLRGFGAFFAGGVLHLSFLMQVENMLIL